MHNRAGLGIVAIFLVSAVLAANAAAAPAPGTIYVATNGRDEWSGRLAAPNAALGDGPLLTLAGARDRIRAARAKGAKTAPHTVLVRQGRYALLAPFVLQPEDSGKAGRPVVYAAYPGEEPVISGGREIRGWTQGKGSVWTVEIPEVKSSAWTFRDLFVNGRRAQRARMPNQGYYRIDERFETKPFSFRYRGREISKSWVERGDVEVIALFAWSELRMPIRQVDEANHLATLAGDARPSNKESEARYYIENAPEGLDAPGEWHLDRKTGRLSYMRMMGEDMTRAVVIAPVVAGQLVRFDGDVAAGRLVTNVVLRGLTFRDAGAEVGRDGYADMQAAVAVGGVIKATGAVECAIERCTVTAVGGYAVELAEGCTRNRVVRNHIFDVGAGGVRLGPPRRPPRTGEAPPPAAKDDGNTDNVVSDNEIHDLGRVFLAGIGVWVGQSSGATIAHNHIHDTNYTAISVGWSWGYRPNRTHHNIVEHNHLHHIGRGVLSDLGAIYTLGVQPGTVIRNNLIHDVEAFTYGGWGIYPDEGSSHIVIENNIVYRTNRAAFHQHYGRENIVRNNIFAFGGDQQIAVSRMEDHLSFTFERNIVYWSQGQLLGGKWASGKEWPACEPEGDDVANPAHATKDCRHVKLEANVYYDARGGAPSFYGKSFAEWQDDGNDRRSVVADPLFVDAGAFDFALRPGSPALKLGFRPIDVRAVGPRPEAPGRRLRP